jgi:CheY-like chemotaxis protein
MRKEVTRFLEANDARTGSRFFVALGLEISVLARVALRAGSIGPSSWSAFNEMQHCCFGQVNAIVHGIDDLFPADASMGILYHYAGQACGQVEFEAAILRAMKQALHGKDPRPSKDEKRVLVLGDDPELRSVIHRLLSQEGLVVFEAETGPEALDKAAWVEPHLMIVDWRPPGINGPEFIKQFKHCREGKKSSVVLLHDRSARLNGTGGKLVDARIVRPFKDAAFVKSVLKQLS